MSDHEFHVHGPHDHEIEHAAHSSPCNHWLGAHLEDDPHFKLAQRLSAHGAVDVVEGVDAGEEVEAEGAAFGDEVGLKSNLDAAAAERNVSRNF